MTMRELNPKLKKFKALLIEGHSCKRASQIMHVSKTTGYEWAQKLEFLGEVRRVPGTLSPILYEDAKRGVDSVHAGTSEKAEPKSGTVNGVVTPTETATEEYAELSRPDKLVRAHISGAYVVKIETVGERPIRLADGQGLTIGGWARQERLVKNTRVHDGFLYGFHEQIKFKLYLAAAGPKLNIYPRPRQVYYKSCTIEGPKLMESQALEVCRVLERYGWAFDGRPALAGVMHYGDIDPRLIGLANRQHQDDNAPVHCDVSNGEPEIEVYADSPTAQRDIDILSTLPERIVSITNALDSNTAALNTISNTMIELTNLSAQLQAIQAQTLGLIAGNGGPAATFSPFDSRGYI